MPYSFGRRIKLRTTYIAVTASRTEYCPPFVSAFMDGTGALMISEEKQHCPNYSVDN